MKLADDEKRCLDGAEGKAVAVAMSLLVEVGESLGAERLIPITSAHVLGHWRSLHQAGTDLLEMLAEGGARCRVTTTVDPSSVDFDRCERFQVPGELVRKQKKLCDLMEDVGVTPSWSCTPYAGANLPVFGQCVAWAESSAVAYANSVIGARTNRTPFGMDICAAVTGRAPEFGLYLDENRAGSVRFDVEAGQLSDLDYHTLGAIVGAEAGPEVPVVTGIPAGVTPDRLKCFGAAAASAGSVALYHIPGVTAEARLSDPFCGRVPKQVHTVTRDDLTEMENKITTAGPDEPVDMVTLGCPLLSVDELEDLHRRMHGRKVRDGMHFWVYIAKDTCAAAKGLGLVEPLERSGVWLSTGTCATVSSVDTWGFSHVMTNSAKCALVVPSEHGVRMTYAGTDACILAATEPA